MPQREHAHVQAGVQTVNLNSRVSLWRRELYSWLFVDSFHFLVFSKKLLPGTRWFRIGHCILYTAINISAFHELVKEARAKLSVCCRCFVFSLLQCWLQRTAILIRQVGSAMFQSFHSFFLPSFLSFFIGSTHNEQHN